MRTEIRGERIILRAYEESFIPMLYEAAMESRGGEFSRWMPWCHENYKLEESRDFVEKTVANWRRSPEDAWSDEMQFGYAVFDAETQKFLGGTGLNQPNKTHRFFNLGYWIRVSAQNRGAASAATRLLAQAAFEDIAELNRIEILASAENIPSRKTAEKAGAHFEGILRKRLTIGGTLQDAAMYSFVREDFES